VAATTDDLARVSLFSTLSERQRKKLAKLFHERTVPAGTPLVTEGTMSGVGFFVVADGEARVTVGGTEVGRLGPGDHFGELALVSEAERSATVTAETQLRCLEIPFWDFRTFAHDNPDVMWKLLQHVVELLSAPSGRT
jgi:CRP/FNR family transcriptional regulator, cyclic AMP receptor protein